MPITLVLRCKSIPTVVTKTDLPPETYAYSDEDIIALARIIYEAAHEAKGWRKETIARHLNDIEFSVVRS